METQTTTSSSNSKMTAIERALAAAKARKAAKAAEEGTEPDKATVSEHPVARSERKAAANKALTAEQREAAKAKREEERTARAASKAEKAAADAAAKSEKKAAREAAKAEKAAARLAAKADRKPAHMKKVERARAKLPALAEEATRLFDEITTNLSIQQIEVIAGHLLVQARAMRTMRAQGAVAPKLGETVRIVGGDPKFVGMTGEVVHSHKLRLLVKVEGLKKPVYLYTGETEPLPAEETPAAAAE